VFSPFQIRTPFTTLKHGRVRANGERQREQHGDRERRIAAEPSSRLAQMKGE
jgi:hypothetical protein